ncbi:unnamed protein product [Sphagnum balticum]
MSTVRQSCVLGTPPSPASILHRKSVVVQHSALVQWERRPWAADQMDNNSSMCAWVSVCAEVWCTTNTRVCAAISPTMYRRTMAQQQQRPLHVDVDERRRLYQRRPSVTRTRSRRRCRA